MNKEIVEMIMKILIAIISVLITGYVIPFLKSKAESTKYNDFYTLVKQCVEAANQIYTPEEWKEKKIYVYRLVADYAVKHGVNVTPEEIDAIIEGFVIAVKGK